MKVVFVNRFYAPDHSATSQMLTDLATALAADGADIHVVTSRLRYEGGGEPLPASETIDGVSVHRVPTSRFGRATLWGRALDFLSFYVTASVRIFALVRAGDIVVAKTDPPLLCVPAYVVARARGAHLVNWLQDLFPEVAAALGFTLGRGLAGRCLGGLRNFSLRGAAANVVLGRLMRDRVVALGADPGKVSIIPNWADGQALRPLDGRANPLRAAWGLGDRFVVGYSGNIGRVHEFETILGAARALRARSDIVFLFIGSGSQQADLMAAWPDLPHENFLFKPYQPRELLDQSLGAADVHLVSLRPRLEGLSVPSKIYGIAAVGRPTIFVGDPAGEVADFVRTAGCGVCVREGDVAGLVASIQELADGLERRLAMGRAARRAFDEHYAQLISVKKWAAVIDAVAHRQSSERPAGAQSS